MSEISKWGFTNMNVTFRLSGHRILPGILLWAEVITLLGSRSLNLLPALKKIKISLYLINSGLCREGVWESGYILGLGPSWR